MTEIERNDVILMLHEKYFCELDLGLGDRDHGVTVSRGWKALSEALTGQDETLEELFRRLGSVMTNSVVSESP